MIIADRASEQVRTRPPVRTSRGWMTALTFAVGLGLGGCGHPIAPDADASPAADAAPVPAPGSSEGPYGPSHRREAIARAATVAQQRTAGAADITHPSARFSTTTLPGSDAPAVACWTVIFPTRLSDPYAAASRDQADTVAPVVPAAPPRPMGAGMAPMSGGGTASAGSGIPVAGMPTMGMNAPSGHALGQGVPMPLDGRPSGTLAVPGAMPSPALFVNTGSMPPPRLLPLASTAIVASAPTPQPVGAGMPDDPRTAYAPPPLVVFVMEDGRTVMPKPRL